MPRLVLKDVTYRFTLKYPRGRRTTFAIERREGGKSTTQKLPELVAINAAFARGELSEADAERQAKELIERLYKDAGALRAEVFNGDNHRLLDSYWNKEYGGRTLVDPATAKYEVVRAVEAMGPLSLYVASREEIHKAIEVKKWSPNKVRRIVAALTRLLTHAGRDLSLRKPKPEKRRVKYLRETEFKQMLQAIPLESLRVLHQVAFYTGGRIGEIFAMEPDCFNEEKLEVRIRTQVDKQGVERDTKNRRERVALIFPSGVKALKKWFELKHKVDPLTRKQMARVTKAACMRVFPSDKKKHLVFHDLRHCYAVMLREKGLSTEDVADLIGDSLIVCKEHYTGFGPTDAIMDARRRALRRSRS